MRRHPLLASIPCLALVLAGTLPAGAEEAAVAVETIVVQPAPPPRGLLGGLFKRKPKPVEVSPEMLLSLEETMAPAPAPAVAAIDLVPPDAALAEAPPAEPAEEKPAFVLRKVADAEVPLPHPNPRRAPAAEVDVAVAVASPVVPEGEPEAELPQETPSFEPEVPPPASAAAVPDSQPDASPPEHEVAPEPVPMILETTPAEPTPPADHPEVPETETVDVAVPEEPAPAVVEPAPVGTEDAPRVVGPTYPGLEDGHDLADPAPTAAAADLLRAPEPEPEPEAEPESEPVAAPGEMDQRMAAEVLVAAAHDTDSPRALVELLIRSQDAIAVGSVPALAAQRRIRAEIDRVFAEADPSVWQEPANTVAAATYVFSGGNPDILRRFATLDPPPAGDARLWRGALAYVEGRQGEAAGMLLDLDIRDLPAGVGGQVALAQAALVVGTDPRRALERLDMARLVAPGTLVEEAAIRRGLLVTEQLRDQDRFEMLVRQYLARFRQSIYAGNFRYRFASALTRSPILEDPAQFARLDAMLEQLGPDARRAHYLTVASAAVVSGKMAAAAYAADRALALARPGSPDQSRGRLYQAAALYLDAETFKEAEDAFAAINAAMLDPADTALYDAVGGIALSIRSGVEPTALALVPASGPMPGDEAADETDPVVARARALSGDVELLLAGAS